MKAILAAVLAIFALSQVARAEPAMWEARDVDSRIVLFGSVHVLPPDLDWRTPALDAAMAASEHVYFETDIGPRGLAALTVKTLVAAFQSAGMPWLHLLTDQQVLELSDALAPLGLSVDDAGRMPPWVVAMQLSAQQLATGTEDGKSFEADSGVEWVLQWALPPERKAYLETPGEQFDLIAAGTTEEQVDLLISMLTDNAEGPELLGELIDAWLAGDVEGLIRLSEPRNDNEAAAYETLLFQRNRNWLPALEKLLAANSESLVVVGAAHLVGDGSVLDLLEQAGYTVTRIQ